MARLWIKLEHFGLEHDRLKVQVREGKFQSRIGLIKDGLRAFRPSQWRVADHWRYPGDKMVGVKGLVDQDPRQVMQFVPGLGEATAGQQQQEVAIGAARCQI